MIFAVTSACWVVPSSNVPFTLRVAPCSDAHVEVSSASAPLALRAYTFTLEAVSGVPLEQSGFVHFLVTVKVLVPGV